MTQEEQTTKLRADLEILGWLVENLLVVQMRNTTNPVDRVDEITRIASRHFSEFELPGVPTETQNDVADQLATSLERRMTSIRARVNEDLAG